MKKSRGHSIPLLLEPRAVADQPLYRRLFRRIREGVLNGAIAPGTRLPSSRTLAREEGIAARARHRGLATPALSSYCIERPMLGLLVHYGNAPPSEIERGTRRLAELL